MFLRFSGLNYLFICLFIYLSPSIIRMTVDSSVSGGNVIDVRNHQVF